MKLLIGIVIVACTAGGSAHTAGRWTDELIVYLGTTPFWIGFVIVIVVVLALSWPWWIREIKAARSHVQRQRSFGTSSSSQSPNRNVQLVVQTGRAFLVADLTELAEAELGDERNGRTASPR